MGCCDLAFDVSDADGVQIFGVHAANVKGGFVGKIEAVATPVGHVEVIVPDNARDLRGVVRKHAVLHIIANLVDRRVEIAGKRVCLFPEFFAALGKMFGAFMPTVQFDNHGVYHASLPTKRNQLLGVVKAAGAEVLDFIFAGAELDIGIVEQRPRGFAGGGIANEFHRTDKKC